MKSPIAVQDLVDVGISRPLLGHTIVANGKTGWINFSPTEPLLSLSQFYLPTNGSVPHYASQTSIQGRPLFYPYGVSQ